jgi:hypothetical protein
MYKNEKDFQSDFFSSIFSFFKASFPDLFSPFVYYIVNTLFLLSLCALTELIVFVAVFVEDFLLLFPLCLLSLWL